MLPWAIFYFKDPTFIKYDEGCRNYSGNKLIHPVLAAITVNHLPNRLSFTWDVHDTHLSLSSWPPATTATDLHGLVYIQFNQPWVPWKWKKVKEKKKKTKKYHQDHHCHHLAITWSLASHFLLFLSLKRERERKKTTDTHIHIHKVTYSFICRVNSLV